MLQRAAADLGLAPAALAPAVSDPAYRVLAGGPGQAVLLRRQWTVEGTPEAVVLAAAGLRRLGFESRISLALPVSACVPAPGQGIVAIEIRADNDPVRRVVAGIAGGLAPVSAVGDLIVPEEVVDAATGEVLPAGAPGEVVVRGPNVTPGYWQDPTATAAATPGHSPTAAST